MSMVPKVTHAYGPSAWMTKAGSQIQGQPVLCSKFHSRLS